MIYAAWAAVFLVIVGGLVALAKAYGKREVKNEDMEKAAAVRDEQISIAARPPAEPDAILGRMRSNDL